GGGSGTCRRAGPRLRRGRHRGALAGPAFGHRRQGDQAADRGLHRQGRRWRPAGRAGGQDHGRDRGLGAARDRHHGRDLRRLAGAGRRHRAGQPDHRADGRDHPAERRPGGRGLRRGTLHGGTGRGPGPGHRGVPPRGRLHLRGQRAGPGSAGGAVRPAQVAAGAGAYQPRPAGGHRDQRGRLGRVLSGPKLHQPGAPTRPGLLLFVPPGVKKAARQPISPADPRTSRFLRMITLKTLSRFLADLSMKRKFLLQAAFVAVGIVALAVVAARLQYLDLTATRQAGVRSQVEMALGVIGQYAALVEAGELDEDAAKAAALQALRGMRASGGVDYFFVTDRQPRMLMHPDRPDLEGKPLHDVLSADGKAIFPEFVRQAEAGGGIVDYAWAKPGTGKEVDKTSFAALYEPWGW